MSNSFTSEIRTLQRALGVEDDGVIGPITVRAMMRELNAAEGIEPEQESEPHTDLDARTLATIATLDPLVRDHFRRFARLAKATAASMGCDYQLISGNRTWAEQDKLYAQGRTAPGPRVTNAKGGASNHNFGIAADGGVFMGKTYLDGGGASQQQLAARVHTAVSLHAAGCGLEWGGSWKKFRDLPHFEFITGLSTELKRQRYEKEGSVI